MTSSTMANINSTIGLDYYVDPANDTSIWDAYSDTFDVSQFDYPGTFKVVPLWEMILKVTFCVITILTALFGNILVILVVVRNKRLQTTTNFYIVNLAIADLLVAVSCAWVHVVTDLYTKGWILGDFFCKFNSFAQGKYKTRSYDNSTPFNCILKRR
jgi:hypothetical protein